MIHDEMIKGVSLGFLAKNGFYRSAAGRQEIDRICASGATWVALVATVMQDSYQSTRMYADYFYTPSSLEVADTIRRFHDHGIKVMLKPMIECHDSVWRGMISFPENQQQIQGITTDYWGKWFKNYTDCMLHYARLAVDTDTEMFCLGCEMLGVEPQEQHWPKLIDTVRQVYSGTLTYNADQYFPNRPFKRDWFSLLDILGVSFYTGTPRLKPTAAQIAEDLQPSVAAFAELCEATKVPLFFAECGARSVENGAVCPWDYRNSGAYDGEIQAEYLRGVIQAFSPQPWWHGLMWWKWDEQQRRPQYEQAGGDAGFTIYGKPAAEVFRQWGKA